MAYKGDYGYKQAFNNYAMTVKVQFPCLNCPNRTMNCHDTCTKYLQCKKEQIAMSKKYREINSRLKRSKRQKYTLRNIYNVDKKEVVNEAKKRYVRNP